ncbi:MAG TPA: VWA domain-containing protein [Clostridia bacterium]|nr:VWA domain-containing protein [Clostridia bacterium]
MVDQEQLKRWRLILGKSADETLESFSAGGMKLDPEDLVMDEALAAIYDGTSDSDDPGTGTGAGKGAGAGSARRNAGLGPSAPKLAKWLADIRTFFSEDVVSVIQSDAIERKGLKQLLFEPELLRNVQPDIEMVATLMSLKGKIPEKTKETARQLVKTVVDEINKRLENDLKKAITGALNKRKHSPIPNSASIDWKYTINRNLKNYSLKYKKIIPERFFFFDRIRRSNNWNVILDMDQSGSMAESIIYGSIAGSIFASMAALNTRIVAFDTEIVDLSEQYDNDPVDMLFGIQLGGGTDINKSVAYCQQFVTDPVKTLFILISDLYEGGNQASLVKRMEELHESGVKVICLLALSDRGIPSYDENLARKISQIGIPCFACTPTLLPELLEGALKGKDLNELAAALKSKK